MPAKPTPVPVTPGRLSPTGMNILGGRTDADEQQLRRLVRRMTAGERRTFWIGVLIRDGAVTVTEALTSLERDDPAEADPPPVTPRRIGRSLSPAVPGRCAECGDRIVQHGPGRPRVICSKPECRAARYGRSKSGDRE